MIETKEQKEKRLFDIYKDERKVNRLLSKGGF